MQIVPLEPLPQRPNLLEPGRFTLGGGRPLYEAWDLTPVVGKWQGWDSPGFTADQLAVFMRKCSRHGLILVLDERGRRLQVTNHRGETEIVLGLQQNTLAGPKVLYAVGTHVYRWQRVA